MNHSEQAARAAALDRGAGGIAFVILSLFFLPGLRAETALPQIIPKIQFFSKSVCYVDSFAPPDSAFRGSGSVVRDSRLVFTCAHVFYDNGVWLDGGNNIYPGYDAAEDPYDGGIPARGFLYWDTYEGFAEKESPEAYDSDFVILYTTSPVGSPFAAWDDGRAVLTSGRRKFIAGYPSEIDFSGANGYAYQHRTDDFNYQGYQEYGGYYGIDRVSTGGGNSGGPVFAYEDGASTPKVAGILVSGTETDCGIRALDAETKALSDYALGELPRTKTFRNTKALKLSDGARKYSSRSLKVSGFKSKIEKLVFNLDVATKRRKDLDVYLKSPTGRIRWVSKRQGAGRNLVVKKADYTKTFRGLAANGTWTVHMRDVVRGQAATFRNFSLTVTAL